MKVFNKLKNTKQIISVMKQRLGVILLGICFCSGVTAQEKVITGVVTDAFDEPLIGVNVLLKGTNKGTITDFDGRYSLSVANAAEPVLEFKYLGYKSKEVKVGNQHVVNVTLSENSKMLDELVVVGYGTQKKSDLTGSVVSVKADDMNAIPTSSVAEMLRGQAAGLVVTQNSARPGGGSDIVIRGKKSLTAQNAPLYIVDGVPVNNIDDFNSQDIQSVEVLKDASSQAIYGARASNGVILVTTKRGASGKTTVDFSGYYGVQDMKRNFDLYSGDEWAQLKREANRSFYYDAASETYKGDYLGGNPVDGVYPGDPSLFGNMYDNMINRNYTDWEKLMIKSAAQQKYDVSVRTGNDKTKLVFAAGYFDQQGMIEPAAYQRGNFRMNADHKFSDKLTLTFNANYTLSSRSQEDESVNKFLTESPLLSPYDDNGNLVDMLADSKWNPAFNNQNMENETKTNRLLLNLGLGWDIWKGLKYQLNASMNTRNAEQGIYYNSTQETGARDNGKAIINIDSYTDYLMENMLIYDWKINKDNKLDLLFMQSINSQTDESNQLTGYGFSSDDLGYNNIGNAAKTDPVIRKIIPRHLLSYMGRARYNLMDRYLFSASVRMDGSSVFGKNNKWGVFPAASFGWRISEEKFLSDKDWLSNLKLRLSYGSVGNQAIEPYYTQGLTNSYRMQFGTGDPFVGFLPTTDLYNPDLKWETTNSFNAGVDFSVLKDRISTTIEYYHSMTNDVLVKKSINQVTGYSEQMVNMGNVLNEGVEVTLNFVPVKTKDLTWTLDVMFASNKNEIKKLNGEVDANGNPVNDKANGYFIGYNIDAYYDYQFDGIWQLDDVIPDYGPNYKAQAGDIRIKDVTGEGIINDDDRVVMNRAPQWTGSLSSTLKWKGIDFSLDFYTVQGALRRNAYLYDANSGGDLHGKLNGMKVDYWTLENPSNTAPRPRDATINYLQSLSYQDASYIRLRNITLGYTFPSNLIKSALMNNLRLYATATNLWTKTDFQSYSPEASAGAYPEPRTFIVGFNVSF